MLALLFAVLSFMPYTRWANPPEESFLMMNVLTEEVIESFGPSVDERFSPCSSFKVVLSLIGFDAGILQDEQNPKWDFQEGFDADLEAWKTAQTPQSWLRHSCLWYSKVLASKLGQERLQDYVDLLDYGNRDLTDTEANAVWVSSSLKISPREQAVFIQKMVSGQLPLSSYSVDMTKRILFRDELPGGWKLYGKTGLSTALDLQHSWFIGWVENESRFFAFAYLVRDKSLDLGQRERRIKELLMGSQMVMQ